MLFLHKVLPVFVLPTGLSCLLLVLALLCEKRRRLLVTSALALLYIASLPVVAEALIGRLEDRYPPQTIADCAPADAVIVLGGILGRNHPGVDFPSWGEAVDRFTTGVALVRAGKAGHIVFSRASFPWEKPLVTEGDILREQAIAVGVPAEKIILTPLVGDTADEARSAAAMCRAYGWKHVLLVTSAWHMPRAAWLFTRAGVNFTPFPVDFQRDPLRPLTLIDFLPHPDALAKTEQALREFYGRIYYVIFRPE